MTSKREKKDWYGATKLHLTEESPSREDLDPEDMFGYYDIRRKELWIDPKQEEKTKDDIVQRTKAGTLSHEIGHFRLKHKHVGLFPGQSEEGKREFFEPLVELSDAIGPLDDYKLEAVRDTIQELEVRILQEVKGWTQDPNDSFIAYFEDVYYGTIDSSPQFDKVKNLNIVVAMGRQAITNLSRQGQLTKKQSFLYLSKINRFIEGVKRG